MENNKNIFGEIYDNSPKNKRAIYRKKLKAISPIFYTNFINRISKVDIRNLKFNIVLQLIEIFLDQIKKETEKKHPYIYHIAKGKRQANKTNFQQPTPSF